MRKSKETPFMINEDTRIGVFWNVEDYPIPHDVEPDLIYRKIDEACKGKGCNGEVSIQFYVDKNRFSDDLLRTYSDAGFQINFFTEGDNKRDRNYFVMLDIMLWVFENPSRTNVFVLLKDICGEMLDDFEGLYNRKYGVVLSQKQRGKRIPCGSKAKFLTSLFDDGGNPSKCWNWFCWLS